MHDAGVNAGIPAQLADNKEANVLRHVDGEGPLIGDLTDNILSRSH